MRIVSTKSLASTIPHIALGLIFFVTTQNTLAFKCCGESNTDKIKVKPKPKARVRPNPAKNSSHILGDGRPKSKGKPKARHAITPNGRRSALLLPADQGNGEDEEPNLAKRSSHEAGDVRPTSKGRPRERQATTKRGRTIMHPIIRTSS